MLNEILIDPTVGPLSTLFLLPHVAAMVGFAITAAWAIKVAVLGPRVS